MTTTTAHPPLTVFSEDEQLFRDAVAAFANEEVRPRVQAMERASKLDPELLPKYFDLGLMHGLGHGIGLEVHDPDQFYFKGTLETGSAFTIEPGIYVRENLLDILPKTQRNEALVAKLRPAVTKFRNIGVRIEDDYLITDQGLEWISRAPRELNEVEALMDS